MEKQHIVGKGEPRPVQHDEYILAGRAVGEKWHPRFTYHGFRYVQVEFDGNAKLKSIKARFVHSDFRRAGTLQTSDKTFAALQAATERSYLSNFVGIPTDCPHREKNGWTGDAQLAMETGLWNYDAKGSYVHFLRMAIDSQRLNGAVPMIFQLRTTAPSLVTIKSNLDCIQPAQVTPNRISAARKIFFMTQALTLSNVAKISSAGSVSILLTRKIAISAKIKPGTIS